MDGTQPDLTPRGRSRVISTMQTTIPSPVGPLALTVDDDGALTRIGFGAGDVSDDARFEPRRHPAERVLRRRAHRLRSRPATGRRQPVRAARLGRAAGDPLRRDGQLRRDRRADRPPGQGPRRRPRQRPQPDRDRLPVPPRHRQRRVADRLRRRPREQAHPARPRGRRAHPRDGSGLNRIVSHARRRLPRWRACATSCAPPAPSASSSPRASRGCPWARSACCSSCTPSRSRAPTPRAAWRRAPTPSRWALSNPALARVVDRRGQTLVLRAGAPLAAAAIVVLAMLPDGASLGAIVASAAVAGACQPPVGACMRALWPVLLDTPDRRHAAYSMEGALLEVVYICGPVLIVAGIGSWSTSAAMLACATFLLVGDLAFAAHPISRAWRPHAERRARPHGRAARPRRARARRRLRALRPVGGRRRGRRARCPRRHRPPRAHRPAARAVGRRLDVRRPGHRPPRRGADPPRRLAIALAAWGLRPRRGRRLRRAARARPDLLLVAGATIAPTFVSANGMLDDLAPTGTMTEAFTWTSTGIAVGIAAGSAVAGALVEASSPAVALAALGAGGVLAVAGRPRHRRGAPARPRAGARAEHRPSGRSELYSAPASGRCALAAPTCAGGGIGRRARLRALSGDSRVEVRVLFGA